MFHTSFLYLKKKKKNSVKNITKYGIKGFLKPIEKQTVFKMKSNY